MDAGVHGVESEAAVCPGRSISGVSGYRWPSCGSRTGAGDTLADVAGLTIPPAGAQSLPEGLLGHSSERNHPLEGPAGPLRRSSGLAYSIPRDPDSDRLLAPDSRAPWKGAVSQRVRNPPGNCRSSRKQSERSKEVTNWTEALRWQRVALGDSASTQAATRVNAEQASKRAMRKPTRR